MENSHLVKAHEHARNAATATYGNSIVAAGEAHALAAASFHEATEDTHDAEVCFRALCFSMFIFDFKFRLSASSRSSKTTTASSLT